MEGRIFGILTQGKRTLWKKIIETETKGYIDLI